MSKITAFENEAVNMPFLDDKTIKANVCRHTKYAVAIYNNYYCNRIFEYLVGFEEEDMRKKIHTIFFFKKLGCVDTFRWNWVIFSAAENIFISVFLSPPNLLNSRLLWNVKRLHLKQYLGGDFDACLIENGDRSWNFCCFASQSWLQLHVQPRIFHFNDMTI